MTPTDISLCPPDGAPLASERDAVDLIGAAGDRIPFVPSVEVLAARRGD